MARSGSARARSWLSSVLTMRGEKARAIAEAEQALRLDPLAPIANHLTGRYQLYVGEVERAVARLGRSLELNPHYSTSRTLLAWAYLEMGRERAAVEVVLPLLPAPMRPLMRAGTRVFGVELLFRTSYSMAAWRARDPWTSKPLLAAALLGLLEDHEAAFRCLEETIESGHLAYVKVDPAFDPYRDDPRFDALLARVGLAD